MGSLVRQQAAGAGAQVALLGVLALTVGLGAAGWAAGLAFTVGLWALLAGAARKAGARSLGPADHVTLTRAILIGGVTALVADHLNGGTPLAVLVPLASVALALDAVDGQVARRTGTSSALGARFDMESDAFLILVLSVLAAGKFGYWVLAIGLMRYAFVAASWALPWLNGALPPSRARKVVAALQGVLLVAAGSSLLPHFAGLAAAVVALATLVWSFGRDILWLHRAHRAELAAASAPRVVHQTCVVKPRPYHRRARHLATRNP
ncbi:CDP-alcohol phosphatidyltransferase family protein [Amycolatopsis rhabdoformis]|uniref:CDP-alcohol phosphatidyltransferase family protein n=1 Tax=Amycolatopsis rhabdoformis TaxID=1448059 RepID=A0ABZ1I0I5_9PSEU|nr:CDP-alcohol phosphatidyltransferase family protein [Amycolatopsis rhabdoformis]WSE27411.1 CDP-alcohol phosphatidyltransferase family protein [Amycolatopsis rhabdoformis]